MVDVDRGPPYQELARSAAREREREQELAVARAEREVSDAAATDAARKMAALEVELRKQRDAA